jgi:hypothetical protein
MIGEVNEALVAGLRGPEIPPSGDEPPASKVSPSAAGSAAEESTSTKNTDNKVQLILDATCAPADITYPTDSKLLNEAREKSETLVDVLHTQCPKGSIKPRTYRKIARKKWLGFQKNDSTLKLKFAKSIALSLAILDAISNIWTNLLIKSVCKLSAVHNTKTYWLSRRFTANKKRCLNNAHSVPMAVSSVFPSPM